MGCCGGCCSGDTGNAADKPGAAGLVDKIARRLGSWPFLSAAAASLAVSLALRGHSHGAATCASWRDPAWIAVAICGLPLVKAAIHALFIERRIKATLLISTAMAACAFTGQVFAAGEVAFIMMLGEKLEDWTVGRARKGLARLTSLVPAMARRIVTCPKCLARGEKFKMVPVAEIKPGDGLQILPGETIPVDGEITEGATSVDQSVMTGESLPVDKAPGDEVYSGTINRFGAFAMRATRQGEDSSLQKLVRLVREAEAKKAPVQRIADRWAGILVPASMCLALAVFIGIWAYSGDLHTAMMRAVTILVVFCPCSLALATPTAIMAAIGQAARHGVVIKSGEALERMGKVEIACLDKTGTLTTGRLSVAETHPFRNANADDLLALAAAAESTSGHPLAQAIVREAEKTGARVPESADFRMTPGKGVAAKVGGREIACGNAAWLAENGAALDASEEADAEARRREGKAVVLVSCDGKPLGFLALSDTVRDGAAAMLAEFPAAGLRPVLLTGDHASTARSVADALGIEDVRAELLPSGKAEAIARIQSEGSHAAMVGDGVNDALALETATVGIAMGGAGCDIAVEAADIALIGDNLAKIPYLKRLSDGCVKIIKFNITLSMSINFVAIVLSALGMLTPVTGALVHNLGSVMVVLNAALLYDRNYGAPKQR